MKTQVNYFVFILFFCSCSTLSIKENTNNKILLSSNSEEKAVENSNVIENEFEEKRQSQQKPIYYNKKQEKDFLYELKSENPSRYSSGQESINFEVYRFRISPLKPGKRILDQLVNNQISKDQLVTYLMGQNSKNFYLEFNGEKIYPSSYHYEANAAIRNSLDFIISYPKLENKEHRAFIYEDKLTVKKPIKLKISSK